MTGYYMGVDLGSTTAKTVIVDRDGAIAASDVVQMGAVSRAGLTRSMTGALATAGLDESDIVATIATGYGRRMVPGVGRTFTEITCHARGVAAMCPGTRLVVDIGGQDSKAILIDDEGLVENFTMNDRCASGTGRFFEVLARAIECEIDELAELALAGDKDLEVSSMCATFAETEIISLLARGERREDIAASVHRAVAARTLGLVSHVGKHTPVVMTGGVARNAAAVRFLEEALNTAVMVPDAPQITGAYGAALLARDSVEVTLPLQRDAVGNFPPTAEPGSPPDCATCATTLDSATAGPTDRRFTIPIHPR
ncbi:acyl-CoA dehydratase activase [Rhodococcus sp. LB1]|uniref:acyl-CoA dehydratase activase n=1 Tax=Rhodococcus sp. LB1 TaxID=1807499 RepID=UPI0009EF4EF9|nr:acyl-CoA dehydratase activase [Rhodococcus sp. LB1]